MPAHLELAIIGCGSMGEIHAQCLSRIEHVTMRAFCDADEPRAQSLCAEFQGAYATADPSGFCATIRLTRCTSAPITTRTAHWRSERRKSTST